MQDDINFKPLGENVLVVRKMVEKVTSGGLIIPDSVDTIDKPLIGTVVAIGSKVEEVKVGDEVMFEKHKESIINIDGKDYLIIPLDKIMGVL